MMNILLVIHIIIAFALVVVILMQRSEGGALSGLGGGGAANFMTARGVGNALTRTTAILATLFFITSITLSIIARPAPKPESLLAQPVEQNTLSKEVPVVPAAKQDNNAAPVAKD